MVSNCSIWPSELNQNVFPVFPRNISYQARPKISPFCVFGIVILFSDFFSNFFHPSIFRGFASKDVKKRKRIPLLARQGPALAGTWCASSVVLVFREFDILSFLSLRYGADLCRSRLVVKLWRCIANYYNFRRIPYVTLNNWRMYTVPPWNVSKDCTSGGPEKTKARMPLLTAI